MCLKTKKGQNHRVAPLTCLFLVAKPLKSKLLKTCNLMVSIILYILNYYISFFNIKHCKIYNNSLKSYLPVSGLLNCLAVAVAQSNHFQTIFSHELANLLLYYSTFVILIITLISQPSDSYEKIKEMIQ